MSHKAICHRTAALIPRECPAVGTPRHDRTVTDRKAMPIPQERRARPTPAKAEDARTVETRRDAPASRGDRKRCDHSGYEFSFADVRC